MTDDAGFIAWQIEGVERGIEVRGIVLHLIARGRFAGCAVTPQIELVEVEPCGEWVDHGPPRLTAGTKAMQQHDRWPPQIRELGHRDLDVTRCDRPLAAVCQRTS